MPESQPVAIRLNDTDVDNIQRLILLGAAANTTEAIRFALEVAPVGLAIRTRSEIGVLASKLMAASSELTRLQDREIGRRAERAGPVLADEYFDHLLREESKATYLAAYRICAGEPAGPWRNRLHVPIVLRWAATARPRTIEGRSIRLDALIVSKETGRPGRGHFATVRSYTESEWEALFGGWALCEHEPNDVTV